MQYNRQCLKFKIESNAATTMQQRKHLLYLGIAPNIEWPYIIAAML